MRRTRSVLNATVVATVAALFVLACSDNTKETQPPFEQLEVHRSDALVITQVTENTFIHTSYHQTNDFGNVPCNGLVVRDGKDVIIFDTPTKDSSSVELIDWVDAELHGIIKAIIPTHWHHDCLGGLNAFHARNIPSYANALTIELAAANGAAIPQHAFSDSILIKAGTGSIRATFFGAGHTLDNVVGYFAKEQVLFGGCLIKEVDATKGYLGDADTTAWSATVERVKQAYPDVRIVVPGHGAYGGQELLDYTIQLFKPAK
ncbi:MAG: subclass B1 metallo-beta-lactamase [Flavobacteriales bacterium]|nr:subclass B1 metallo-beta-lactamase [Flavobacteriales bacterium]